MTMVCDRCKSIPPESGKAFCNLCSLEDAFLKEDVTACPPLLGLEDFARFMHKLAVHAHTSRMDKAKGVSLTQMEESLTDAVLKALPLYYVSTLEYDENRRRSTGWRGSYTFKAALPKAVLYKTVEKLKLWTPKEDEDGFHPEE